MTKSNRIELPNLLQPDEVSRFWSFTRESACSSFRGSKCLEWQGAQTGNGYGSYRLPARFGRAMVKAHRMSYTVAVGAIADGLDIDHLCRNTLCVNPGHLEAVTPRENTLRGVSMAATNAIKTKCAKGHDLSGVNLFIETRGDGRNARHCAICRQEDRRRLTASFHTNPRLAKPPLEVLAGLLKERSWCAIGRLYGVSDNAVRKWARSYGLL